MMNKKALAVLLTIAVFSASVLAGCVITQVKESGTSGEGETPTERRTRTEKTTEAPTEGPTEAPTEGPTPPETAKTREGEQLKEFRYSSGGGMNGDTYSVEMNYQKDGSVRIVMRQSPEHWIAQFETIVDPGDDALARMQALLEDSGMNKWKDVEPYYIALDGPSTSLTYTFQVGDDWNTRRHVSVSLDGDFTDEDSEKVKAARDLLFTLYREGTVISAHALDEDGEPIPEGADARLPEKTIRYLLSGYWNAVDVVQNGEYVGSAEAVPEKWQWVWLSGGQIEMTVNVPENMTIRQGSEPVFPVETSWSAVTKDGSAEMTMAGFKLYIYDHETELVYIYERND